MCKVWPLAWAVPGSNLCVPSWLLVDSHQFPCRICEAGTDRKILLRDYFQNEAFIGNDKLPNDPLPLILSL